MQKTPKASPKKASSQVAVGRVSEIGFQISETLENGLMIVDDLLGIEDSSPSIDEDEYYEQGYSMREKLPSDVVKRLMNFSKDVIDSNITKTRINHEFDPNLDMFRILLDYRNIVFEQLEYTTADEKNCQVWVLYAIFENKYYYGSIFAFYNSKNPDVLLIQGISKGITPILFSILFPEKSKNLPKLNSLFDEPLEKLARELGVKRIVVAPIGKQGDILEKHYGFRRVPTIEYPCELIRESGKTRGTFYAKEIK